MFIETNQDCSSGNESINMAKYYYGVITVHGKDEKTYKLSSDVTFGRLGKCDIRLEGKSVSREHAKISIDENGCCYLENMSHTNPTELNGEKVCGLVKLHDKDKIMIGDISIHYNAPDDGKCR
jgi:pSer/pThr/pTyr-binding forkhead associated (FHA) protein